jgi:hypothetical protein
MLTKMSSIFDRVTIPSSAQIILVADLFCEDYVGGAELTTEALVESSPYEIFKLHSKDVSLQLLEAGQQKHWIFCNYAQLNQQLIPTIVANLRYSIIEYDYKYCRARSPEKHASIAKSPCDCHNTQHGKMISAFMYGAQSLWWMSEKQKQRYVMMFPFLEERPNIVLSSVFSNETLQLLRRLREQTNRSSLQRKKWQGC